MTSRLAKSLFAAVLLVPAGCGGGPQIVPFSGRVLYKDQPLQFGNVMFQPVSGGQAASGMIGPDGTFVMKTQGAGEGATVGTNRVRVTCYPAQNTASAANVNQELALGQSLIPTHYSQFGSSGLTVEVKAEGNEPYVIELEDE